MNRYRPPFNLRWPTLALGAASLILFALSPGWADTPVTQDIDWLRLFIGLFGGLALFLLGMEQMADEARVFRGLENGKPRYR